MWRKEIIFGCLLGDASLQTYTNGKTWRIRFIQGEKNKEYLWHLYEMLKEYVSSPPKKIEDKEKNIRWYFNSTTKIPEFEEFGAAFYLKTKKRIPDDSYLEKYLTPRALCYWYMDDGSKKSNAEAGYLCTESFELRDLKRVEGILKKRYDISISFHKTGKNRKTEGYRIYIPVKEFKKFKLIIEPYIQENFRYKL